MSDELIRILTVFRDHINGLGKQWAGNSMLASKNDLSTLCEATSRALEAVIKEMNKEK